MFTSSSTCHVSLTHRHRLPITVQAITMVNDARGFVFIAAGRVSDITWPLHLPFQPKGCERLRTKRISFVPIIVLPRIRCIVVSTSCNYLTYSNIETFVHRITRILSIRNFRINPNNVNKIHFHEASTIISPLINSKVLSLPSLFDSSKSSPSQNSARDRGIDRRIKTRFCTRLVFFLNETSHRGQRGRERDGERFSPTAVSHPSLLQIVYPSRGGPSTRRILYYRLEYLTRQETPRHRGIGKEVSPRTSFLFHLPFSPSTRELRCTTAAPNSFRLDRGEEFSLAPSFLFSFLFSSRWARNLLRYGLLSIHASITSFTPWLAGVNIVERPSSVGKSSIPVNYSSTRRSLLTGASCFAPVTLASVFKLSPEH